jgi:hypothetical protein
VARMNREIREARAILVAEHALERRLRTIEFEEEVLYPALDRVADGTLAVTYAPGEGVKQQALDSGE